MISSGVCKKLLTVLVKKSLPAHVKKCLPSNAKKCLLQCVKNCLPRDEKTPYHVMVNSSYRAHPGAHGFEQHGIMKCAGDIRELGADELTVRLVDMALQLCNNESDRMSNSMRQGKVVDGKGASRIINNLLDNNVFR